MMHIKKSLIVMLISFALCIGLLNGCKTTEPTMPEYDPAVSDTLKIQAQDSTLNSIRLRLITTTKDPGIRKVKLYRMSDDTASSTLGTLISEYPLGNLDTVILDNNLGKGLLMGKEYKYEAMIADTVKGMTYLPREVTAKTLSLTGDDYSWTEYTFGEFQSDLQAVWGLDENHIYAAGSIMLNGKVNGIMKWDGTSWKAELPFGGFQAIYGFSANDIWAVGGGVFHFNGSEWLHMEERVEGDHVVPVDSVLFTHGDYLALWGTSDSNLYLCDLGGYIIHWDGKKAHVEDVKASLPFRDIWGNSATDIYAAAGQIDNKQGELYHFDGSRWSLIKKGALIPRSGELMGHFNTVWSYNKEELLVAGTVVARDVNNTWSEDAIGFFVERLRGDKPNNLFACGHLGSIAHYNGSKWTKLDAGTNTGTLLRGLFVKDDYVYVVGENGYKAYIYHGKRKR